MVPRALTLNPASIATARPPTTLGFVTRHTSTIAPTGTAPRLHTRTTLEGNHR